MTNNTVKIMAIVFSLIVLIIGCSGGGGGGGSDDNDNSDNESAPFITDVKFYEFKDGVYTEALKFMIGDLTNFEVYASDKNLDIVSLYFTQYLLPDTDTPYVPAEELILPSQEAKDMVYYLIDPIMVEGPAGSWRVCFWVVDEEGNESPDFCVNIIIEGEDGMSLTNSSRSLMNPKAFDFSNNEVVTD